MKAATIFSVLLAGATVQAATVPPTVRDKEVPWAAIQRRQALGMLTTLLGKGGKVADPPGAAPRKRVVESPSKVAGAKRIVLRYGPYSVPNMNKTGLTGEPGALWNYPDTSVTKPCTECTIVAQQAGLEYPDGSNANINSGMWLHHMVHFTMGPGRQDATCYGKRSLPHVDVGTSPSNSERYFSSGNERTFINPDRGGADTKFGYHIKTTDRMAFIVDLMNMNMEDKTVYMTMTYDIVDGPLPDGWRDLKPVWFDANQCGTSEVHPPQQTGQFRLTSGAWTPNFEGEALGVGGHLHDGGETVEIQVNNEVNCDSRAKYAETPEFQFKPAMKMPGAMMGVATDHVSSMKTCFFEELKIRKLDPSQKWRIQALYNYDKFPGNKNAAGKQEEIMAIAIMYVAVKPGTLLNVAAAPPAAAGAAAGAAPAAAAGTGASGRPRAFPKGLAKGSSKGSGQQSTGFPKGSGQQSPGLPKGSGQQSPAAPPVQSPAAPPAQVPAAPPKEAPAAPPKEVPAAPPMDDMPGM